MTNIESKEIFIYWDQNYYLFTESQYIGCSLENLQFLFKIINQLSNICNSDKQTFFNMMDTSENGSHQFNFQ